MSNIYILKRDGRRKKFSKDKIIGAIEKTCLDVDGDFSPYMQEKAKNIANYIENEASKRELGIEDIQDLVVKGLMNTSRADIAASYIEYRHMRTINRGNTTDKIISEVIIGSNEDVKTENSNKNAILVSTQRDLIAGEVSRDITNRILLPQRITKAHKEGILHFHDSDYFLQDALTNCELLDLEDMLQYGTVVNGKMIEKPHRFLTACTIATQIILGTSSSTYGGCTITLSHLAPFVRDSYNKFYNKYISNGIPEETAKELAEIDKKQEIIDGVQTFNYQINTMANTNGQAPFLSVCMYLGETDEYKEELADVIEEFLRQRYQGIKNEQGVYVTPAFPKLLYFLEEDNMCINGKEGKYYYLTKLAAKTTAKRMNPDYISVKKMKELKIDENGEGQAFPCMGCRSFLSTYVAKATKVIKGDEAIEFFDKLESVGYTHDDEENKLYPNGDIKVKAKIINGKIKNCTVRSIEVLEDGYKLNVDTPLYYGRFNQGVVTLNLVDVALSSGGDFNKFWKLMDERTELCREALQIRHKKIAGITSDVAPLLWQHGGFARLGKGESVHKLLHGGYSTLSLGYAGLYECVKYMTGVSHTDSETGEPFGKKVMQYLNDKCNKWKDEEDIGYSVYGSPIESTTYKFAKCLKKRFGEIEGITDRNYITNSYHVPVFEKISAFDKIDLESKFQVLSPGGAISYIEVANLTDNIPAVLSIIDHIYDNIIYCELNTKSDYCYKCGYEKEIEIIDKDGKLVWRCPNCGNEDQDYMCVTRRTCGYLGQNFWNQGRTQDIKERYIHLDNRTDEEEV